MPTGAWTHRREPRPSRPGRVHVQPTGEATKDEAADYEAGRNAEPVEPRRSTLCQEE